MQLLKDTYCSHERSMPHCECQYVQASSITEALLMSPRSMSSTATKVSPGSINPLTPSSVHPLTPTNIPPRTPVNHSTHNGPPMSFPLSPLSLASSHSALAGAAKQAAVGMVGAAASAGRTYSDRLGPELMPSGMAWAITACSVLSRHSECRSAVLLGSLGLHNTHCLPVIETCLDLSAWLNACVAASLRSLHDKQQRSYLRPEYVLEAVLQHRYESM